MDITKGQIVRFFDGTSGVVLRIIPKLWASIAMVKPLNDSSFYTKGEVEEELLHNLKS